MQMVATRYAEAGALATIGSSIRYIGRAAFGSSDRPRPAAKKRGAKKTTATSSGSLTEQAKAAEKRGDWRAAALLWQREICKDALPHIRMAQAVAAMGDAPRADAILDRAMAQMPQNYLLADAHCRAALTTKRWPEAVRRWHMLDAADWVIDPALMPQVVDAMLNTGNTVDAAGIVAQLRSIAPDSSPTLRVAALLAEARGDWTGAAQFWLDRAAVTDGATQQTSNDKAVRALVAGQDMAAAQDRVETLIEQHPKSAKYARLHAELSILQGDWAGALSRWHRVQDLVPAQSAALPAAWVHRIGVADATRQTHALTDPHLRATGMLSLAAVMQPVDEVAALLIARKARRHYATDVQAMVAQVLATNTRHSAAIWWLKRLITQSDAPRPYYPQLFESLLESSRLDECEQLLDGYERDYGQDTAWLRAWLEIHYRRSNFVALQSLMATATAKKRPAAPGTVRVTRWIYDLIRMHPTPDSFFPAQLNPLILNTARTYDGAFLTSSLGMLLNPAQGDAVARSYADQLARATTTGTELDPVLREEMLQMFMRRRDWAQVDAVLALPLPDQITRDTAKKIWNIVRTMIDLRLGQADVAQAEAIAVQFLDQLAQADLDDVMVSLMSGLLLRLPVSVAIVDRLHGATLRLGFDQMAQRLADWRDAYAGIDAAAAHPRADRKRCFIVGNAPSIATLPLHALAGEDIFCVNRGMRALDVGLPQPKYLVVADPLVYKSHAAEIDRDGASVEQFFVASNCLWRQKPTVPAIPLGSSGLKMALAPFRHAPLHLHRGETVVIMAAQIAHLMGYKEIVIIGVDLDYSGPVTHFYGGGRKETERLSNFRPGGSGTELVNLSFQNLQKAVEADGCRLMNAAPGGRLDSLERVDFYDLLGLDKPELEPDHQKATE
ncbi:hypothetical protein [Paracoccus sp. (in: a-proteobacteria)]|uniref:hypothetical protein n=1 Tax=Paracoccus sp. TaxID=267 RepID=UPI0026E04783|nr:hypothetical protein [Paracoccus sp. (in: a-proteobacteria)]MDO5647580.1 hypothetical protein [Paracoccus sp. (in: a-proteobacteria)]